jgi:hypothetical protein
MKGELTPLLNRLWEILTTANAPLAMLLQKGIDNKTVDKNIQGLNIKLPDEVYELYEWRNGTFNSASSTFDQTWMFRFGSFCSIENSVEGYNYFVKQEQDEYWNKNMFRLFESGGGEMYLIDCDKKSPTYRMVFKHYAGAVDYEVIITVYDSLKALFTTIVECFETKAYYFNERGGLQFDFKKEVPISRKNNPLSKLWKLYNF